MRQVRPTGAEHIDICMCVSFTWKTIDLCRGIMGGVSGWFGCQDGRGERMHVYIELDEHTAAFLGEREAWQACVVGRCADIDHLHVRRKQFELLYNTPLRGYQDSEEPIDNPFNNDYYNQNPLTTLQKQDNGCYEIWPTGFFVCLSGIR